MPSELGKIGIFLRRDFAMLSTYKFAFVTNTLSKFFIFFWMVLIGKIFGQTSSILSPYGGNFISFVLVGTIGWSLSWNIIDAMIFSVRNEMLMGTIEAIFLTPTSKVIIMLAYGIFGFVFGMISVISFFLVGLFAFDINIFAAANLYTLAIFILSCTTATGIGLILCGLTFWQKYLGQFVPFLQGIAVFFSEVYFPTAVLPSYLQPLSQIVPFYYSIKGIRLSLLGIPTTELIQCILVLFILTIVFFMIGFFTLDKCIAKAKRDGTLSFY